MAHKVLRGDELASFIKERQAKQVRMLRQAHKIFPKLVVIMSQNASEVIQMYVRMKQRYAQDILIDVEVVACAQADMRAAIARANADDAVHGVIVQLPLDDVDATEALVNEIAPQKDVDGLGEAAQYYSATAEAIDWLLAGHGVELKGKNIVLVGAGRLVGAPLAKMWQKSGHSINVVDKTTKNILAITQNADILVTATGVPGLLTNQHITPDTTVVDAGTASEGGVVVGDVASEVRMRDDISLTPVKGGVGPLTIVLLFDHLIRAALAQIDTAK